MRVKESMDEWMDEGMRVKESMDEWMDEWMRVELRHFLGFVFPSSSLRVSLFFPSLFFSLVLCAVALVFFFSLLFSSANSIAAV